MTLRWRMIHQPLAGVQTRELRRYCPHQGADMKDAVVANGVITCPLHGWQFSSDSGDCVQGGRCALKIERIEW